MDAFDDRRRGSLLGLAIGDALGAAVEFQRPGTFRPVTGYRAGGPHGLGPGEWTDDTSMALALADSMVKTGWDLNDQTRRYVSWWRTGEYSVNGRCFDIGGTTSAALSRFQRTGDAFTSGDPSEHASGNGSIMRVAPVPIRFAHLFPDQLDKLCSLAAESSLPTHASPQCLSACRYLALILAGLMHGLDRSDVLSPDWAPLQKLRATEPLHWKVEAIAAGSFRGRHPPEIAGTGHVVRSLEAALWAFHDARDLREAVLRAVNLGDDADTTGAVCGQLAGAYWSESEIPKEWREGLARPKMIETGASRAAGGTNMTGADRTKFELAPSTSTPPTSYSYWVVSSLLLAGAYPGASKPAEHRRKIQDLVDAGIRTFVNLMEENETNQTGDPFVPYHDLAQQLCKDVTCVRHPIQDLSVPKPSEMVSILDAIDATIRNGKPVYVHCWGGVGRTGTVIGCWLLRHKLAETSDVLDVLMRLRQQDRERRHRKSPETEEQLTFLRQRLDRGQTW